MKPELKVLSPAPRKTTARTAGIARDLAEVVAQYRDIVGIDAVVLRGAFEADRGYAARHGEAGRAVCQGFLGAPLR